MRIRRVQFMVGVAVAAVLATQLAACGSKKDSGASTTAQGQQVSVDAGKCPAEAKQVLSGDTIRLGGATPLTGPSAAASTYTATEKAYFESLNAQGGIDTAAGKKKIDYTIVDNQYSTSKTQTAVRQLVEQDKVFALAGIFGTAGNEAVAPYLNDQCIPQLFGGAASGLVLEKNWPFTTEPASYTDQGAADGNYIKKNFPNATVAILYQNDDLGQGPLKAVQAALAGSNVKVVSTQSYEPNAPSIANQMTTLAATKADIFLSYSFTTSCTQSINDAFQAGWLPKAVFTHNGCGSDYVKAADPQAQAAMKIYETNYLIDANDPAFVNDPGVKQFKQVVASAGLQPSASNANGFIVGQLTVLALQRAKELTRVGVAEAAINLNGDHIAMIFPNLTTAGGRAPLREFLLLPWDTGSRSFSSKDAPVVSATSS